MGDPFIKIHLDFSNQSVADSVAAWLQDAIDGNMKIRGGFVEVIPPEARPDSEFYLVNVQVTLTSHTNRNTLFNSLKDKNQTNGVRQYIEHAKVWEHDCDHKVGIGQCTNTLIYEWSR